MSPLFAIFFFALTRAEIIERFRASPVTRVDGLVQVIADAPADMRKEYQMPIAGFTGDLCMKLYGGVKEKPKKFNEPGIIVYIGDCRTNDASVIARPATRPDGTPFTRIFLPAPGYADTEKLRLETVKAFYRAVKGETLDDAAALAAVIDCDPELRARSRYLDLERWLEGEQTEEDDEYHLKLTRTVLLPGVAYKSDVLRFASRLYLYPGAFDLPFLGRYRSLDLRRAVKFARKDARIRIAAYLKAQPVAVFGCGRGEELNEAALAYSRFLLDLAASKKTEKELLDQLEEADILLNVAYEKAKTLDK